MATIRKQFGPTDPPARIEITRCRNGFILTTPASIERCDVRSIEDVYVFPNMDDLNNFLIGADFEITDE